MEGVFWVNLAPILLVVMAISMYCPEGRAVLVVVGGLNFLFLFFKTQHKCTEETLVALKKSQINNLGLNDSQVWPAGPPSAPGSYSDTSPTTLVARS